MKPLLTLFTAPKPFTTPHINLIQRNTLRNWLALGEAVEIVVIGDEPGIAAVCEEFGVRHLPDVVCNEMGTPLISSIFDLARGVNESPCLAYSNADILFLPGLVDAVRVLLEKTNRFLAIGQRWDLDVTDPLTFSGDWEKDLNQRVQQTGVLHPQTGSDYFIYPRECFKDIPDFAVGRAGWDNWMIFKARWEHWSVVDSTNAITIIHQNHDYGHLPNGRIHYVQPESIENIKLAGGRTTIFNMTDATHQFDGKVLRRKPLTWLSFWREVEIFPLVGLHSRWLGWVAFALFRPLKAFRQIRGWLAYKFNRQ